MRNILFQLLKFLVEDFLVLDGGVLRGGEDLAPVALKETEVVEEHVGLIVELGLCFVYELATEAADTLVGTRDLSYVEVEHDHEHEEGREEPECPDNPLINLHLLLLTLKLLPKLLFLVPWHRQLAQRRPVHSQEDQLEVGQGGCLLDFAIDVDAKDLEAHCEEEQEDDVEDEERDQLLEA